MKALSTIDAFPHAPVWNVASTFEINEAAAGGSSLVDPDGAFRMKMSPVALPTLYARCRDITSGTGEVLMTARIRDFIAARKNFVRAGIVVGTGSPPTRICQFFGLTGFDNNNVALTGAALTGDLTAYSADIGSGIDLAARFPLTLRLRWSVDKTYLELMRGTSVLWAHANVTASRPTFAGIAIGNENAAGNTTLPVVAAFDSISLSWS